MNRESSLQDDGQGGNVLAVIIVNWNTCDLLWACLTSTIQACRRLCEPFDIVVVDNASTDGSAAMVRREFPGVTLMANDFNAGFAAANNQAIQATRSRYVLLLNPDTEMEPDTVQELVEFLEGIPSAGAAGPLTLGRDGKLQVTCEPLPTLLTEVWRMMHLDGLHPVARYPAAIWHADEPREVETLKGSCMLIRRKVIDEVGFLDERFFMYSEEVDLCHRILDHNWRLYWVPQARIVHYGGESTRQVQRKMFLQLYRAKVEYFRKYSGRWGGLAYKAILLLISIPRIMFPLLLMPWNRWKRAELSSVFRNYCALVASLPSL